MVKALIGEGLAYFGPLPISMRPSGAIPCTCCMRAGCFMRAAGRSDQAGGGRVFRVPVPADQRRAVLRQALDQKSVLDGVIQGASVRLLMRAAQLEASVLGDLTRQASPVKPRFEDAVRRCPGRARREPGLLAAAYARVAATDQAGDIDRRRP